MTSRIAGIVTVVNSEVLSVQSHKVGHRDVVNRTGMGHVFFRNLIMTPRGSKMFSSGREFSDQNYFTILIEVKFLSGQVDYDSRASIRI